MKRTRWLTSSLTGLALLVLLAACGNNSNDDVATATVSVTRPASSPLATTAPTTETSTSQVGLCPEEANDQGFQNYDQFGSTLTCVATLFSWPPSRSPSVDAIRSGFTDPQNASFERGLAYTILSNQHTCAWYGDWLDNTESGNTAAAGEDLQVMTDVIPHYDTVIVGFPSDITSPIAFREAQTRADRAALGDPAPVQQFYDVQCSAIVWATPA